MAGDENIETDSGGGSVPGPGAGKPGAASGGPAPLQYGDRNTQNNHFAPQNNHVTASGERSAAAWSIGAVDQSQHYHYVVPEAVGTAVSVVPPFGLRDAAVPLRGRDDLLTDLEADLHPGPGGGAGRRRGFVVLAGMGGCGKTSLALEAAARCAELGVRVWWVDARSTTALEAGLRAVARQAGADPGSAARGDGADVLWQHLDQLAQSWLLVVDNADDPRLLDGPGHLAAGTGWIRPTTGHGTVLVTTRDHAPATWGPTARLHRVRPLDGDRLDHAARILLDHAGPEAGTPAEARDLAERLGGLPLALHLAGAYLAQVRTTPTALHAPDTPDTFTAYRQAWSNTYDTGNHRRTLAQAWEMSVALLEQRGHLHARHLLELLTAFADADLPYLLLLSPRQLTGLTAPLPAPAPWRALRWAPGLRGRRTGTTPHAPQDPSRTAPESLADGAVLWQHLTALADVGLIELPQPEPGVLPLLRIHPLVRDAVRTDRTRPTAARLLTAAADADADETGLPEEPAAWPLWRALAPHILHAFHHARHHRTPELPGLARAAALTARYFEAAGLHRQARAEYEAVLAARQELLGDTHPDTLTTRNNLAVVLLDQGELQQARAEYEAVLAARREQFGDMHPDTLATRHNLAGVLQDQGELQQARTEYEAVLAAQREQLGDLHPHTEHTRLQLTRVVEELGGA